MNKSKAGRKSLSQLSGENTYRIKILITESQRNFINSRSMPAAEYIRNLIDSAMEIRSQAAAGEPMKNFNMQELLDKFDELEAKFDEQISKQS